MVVPWGADVGATPGAGSGRPPGSSAGVVLGEELGERRRCPVAGTQRAAAAGAASVTVTGRPSGRSRARTPRRSPRATSSISSRIASTSSSSASLRAATSAAGRDGSSRRSSSRPTSVVARCWSPVSRVAMSPPRTVPPPSRRRDTAGTHDPYPAGLDARLPARRCGPSAALGQVRGPGPTAVGWRPAGARRGPVPRSGSSVGTRCSASRSGRSKITESHDAAATWSP